MPQVGLEAPSIRSSNNMSSLQPRHAEQQRWLAVAEPPSPADAAGALPMDALYEILLRLPGKLLCRLRTVCRAWRSLLSAPWFAAAHAARRPEPYVVASYVDDVDADRDCLVDVVDMLSGRIVRRVAAADASDVVVSMAAASGDGDGLVCVVKTIESGSFRLLDPVTGAVHRLSGELAPEHAARGFSLRDYGEPVHMFGLVAGTGELKVLRMLPDRGQLDGRGGGDGDDLFEVCTLAGSSRGGNAPWRGKPGPPSAFVWNEWTRVVVGGVVYCLSVAAYFAVVYHQADEQGWIVGFDLEAEQWRPSIKGPSGLVNGEHSRLSYITLANLNGSLVIVHGSPSCDMDLWFLKNSEEGLFWVKQYRVQTHPHGNILPMHPLLVLEDGMIVTVIRSTRPSRRLKIYDPRTSTFTSLTMLRHFSRVSVHTGSFLSLNGEN